MIRQRALKVVLVLVGLLFSAAIYPVMMILWQRDQAGYTDAMMGSIYLTLGILLLIAVRNPSAHRSLILFAGWSSLAHASVMAIMAVRDPRAHEHLWGVGIFAIIGIPLLLLAPTKEQEHRSLASGA
jgi:Na+/H+ antiporter NhaA